MKKPSKKNQCVQATAKSATQPRIIQGDSIKGSDDVGNYYNTQAELAQHQELHRDGWYATNNDWWRHDGGGGYGGNTDEEAMIGDGGGEADGLEGLAFLDRLILKSESSAQNRKKLKFSRAIDAGAGVGRVTKHILLKRYDTVNLVEADAGWSKRSKTYLGRKRAARCTFTCSRIEELVHDNDESSRIDLVWLQWTLQYLTDSDAVRTLQNLATSLILTTGILIVKENRPYGTARPDRFQMDTPGGSGRYDITRSDDHHRLLFQRAGLTVNHVEEGVETNTYALSRNT
jgi:protein N-terminal methyltransferase